MLIFDPDIRLWQPDGGAATPQQVDELEIVTETDAHAEDGGLTGPGHGMPETHDAIRTVDEGRRAEGLPTLRKRRVHLPRSKASSSADHFELDQEDEDLLAATLCLLRDCFFEFCL